MTPKRVEILSRFQRFLLENMLEILEKYGTLVYATCSVLPEEGEEHIDSMINKVKLQSLQIPGRKGYDNFKCSPFVKRLFPHIHNTSGFFIAKMMKN
jgi:16S rRNA (cytosine967-C5)-methyltransferase